MLLLQFCCEQTNDNGYTAVCEIIFKNFVSIFTLLAKLFFSTFTGEFTKFFTIFDDFARSFVLFAIIFGEISSHIRFCRSCYCNFVLNRPVKENWLHSSLQTFCDHPHRRIHPILFSKISKILQEIMHLAESFWRKKFAYQVIQKFSK